MPTAAPVIADLDAWFAQTVHGSFGNGSGPRMWVGHLADDDWRQRSAVRFPLAAPFGEIAAASQIEEARLRLRASRSCFTQGSAPKLLVEEITDAWDENAASAQCSATTTGTVGVHRWPGPNVTTANRAFWEGTPDNNEWIDIVVTDLIRAAKEVSKTSIGLRLAPSNATGTAEAPTTAARRIGFHTRHSAGSEPQLVIDYRRPGAWVRRSGVWVQADSVQVRRSGAWVDVETVAVRRSGAWIDAD